MPIKLAQTIIEKFFLKPGESILRARQHVDRVLVTSTERQWRVMTVPRASGGEEGSCKYTIFNVSEDIYTDPGLIHDKIAVLPDDRMFNLQNDTEFREFFASVGESLTPEEIATLVAYHQGIKQFGANQNLVLDEQTLTSLIGAEQILSVRDFVPLLVERRDNGATLLSFCTASRESRKKRGDPRTLRLVRWQIEVGGPEGITWLNQVVAENLVDIRYLGPRQ